MLLQIQDLPRKVTKDFLLQQVTARKIKAAPQFQFSNQVIALFNLQSPRSNLPLTVALDYQQGLIMTPRTTRQLLNDFSHQSIFNFQQSRMLVRQTQHPHFLPLILGRAAYLPLAGVSHGSTDWVGLHWQQDCWQNTPARQAEFITLQNKILQFTYSSYRNLEDAVHLTSYYSEYLCRILQLIVQASGTQLESLPAAGLMHQFAQCSCRLHRQLPQTNSEVRQFLQSFQDWTLRQIAHFSELQLSAPLQEQTLKFWRSELAAVHCLW